MAGNLENIKTILFDFDGTIADTLTLGVNISNELSAIYGYKAINNQEELSHYRSLNTKKAIKEIGISLTKLPIIANAFRKRLSKSMGDVKPIDDIVPIIESLSKKYTLGIITSNSKANLNTFLLNNYLKNDFSYQCTGIQLFSKSRTISRFLNQQKLNPTEVLMVGDETRDIEASRKCGLQIVSVTWGFHSSQLLDTMKPDFLIHNPAELLKVLS